MENNIISTYVNQPTDKGVSVAKYCSLLHQSWADFRDERLRCKRYTYGQQWLDTITVGESKVTERRYIESEGQIPLQNNMIRKLVRSVVGVNTNRLDSSLSKRSAEQAKRDRQNGIRQFFSRAMEEFLISGLAVARVDYRGTPSRNHPSVGIGMVRPANFFFNRDACDPRGRDVNAVGQLLILPVPVFAGMFATTPRDFNLFMKAYEGKEFVRVYEIWKLVTGERVTYHRPSDGKIMRVSLEEWNANRHLHNLPHHSALVRMWEYKYVTTEGVILREGDSPLPGGRHPFIFRAYPLIDSEIHSFVSDVIDQQRYCNRLITAYDWILRSSAKGVLLIPEQTLRPGDDPSKIAKEWSRCNGVIPYIHTDGVPAPHQASAQGANQGIDQLLQIELKMMEDVSGVNAALQGRVASTVKSGTMLDQQTQNALTSLRDIIDTFEDFVDEWFSVESIFLGEEK